MVETFCDPSIEKDCYLPCVDQTTLYLDHFKGTHQLQLHIQEFNPDQMVCFYIARPENAFPTPYYTTSFFQVPEHTYLVLAKTENKYACFLCLSHSDCLVSFQGLQDQLLLHVKGEPSQLTNFKKPVLLIQIGNNLYQTLAELIRQALHLTGGLGRISQEKLCFAPWLKKIGWESGAYFGTQITHQKIIDSVSSLIEQGIQPSFVLIDEGWQDLQLHEKIPSMYSLASFEANPYRFPFKLQGLIQDLNKLGIYQVGVWHALMGARGGIAPQLAQNYKLPVDLTNTYYLGKDLGQTFQFYCDYYQYLREQGITFIKVGDQHRVGRLKEKELNVTQLYRNLQSCIQAAASIQFNTAHFNTDCLVNANLFYWSRSDLGRVAEDMDLQNPVEAMRTIRNALLNTLWAQHLFKPDFDAWTTRSENAETLAIFHALSGSINVIGDPPETHNLPLFRKLALPSGHILKPDQPLTLCLDSIFIDPLDEKKIYKAFTYVKDTGILAVFNLTQGRRALHGTVTPADFDEGLEGEEFALLSHHNGFLGILKKDEAFPVSLRPGQSDVLTFAPVRNGVAVFGCYSFFLAPYFLSEINHEPESLHISCHVAAPMIIYSNREVLEVRRNGHIIPWEYDERRKTLSIDSRGRIVDEHSLYTIIFES